MKKASSTTKKKKNIIQRHRRKRNFNLVLFTTFAFGVILIVSTYAWFNVNLNVKITTFNMIVANDGGLTISFDGIDFSDSLVISSQTLIEDIKTTYPNNVNQWALGGLIPVSSNGISDPNSDKFLIFRNKRLDYKDRKHETRYLTTVQAAEVKSTAMNSFVAFDLFFKNVSGSPVSDNLYLEPGTGVEFEGNYDHDKQMEGLINSIRFGFVKVGSVPNDSTVNTIQNISCNGNCSSIIFEPNHLKHSELSAERAKEYGINLVDGRPFQTYGEIAPVKQMDIRHTISGSVALNKNYFELQETKTDFEEPLFAIPDGITKVRVYVWIEGQDIDSLETHSGGANIALNMNFIKDTAGYEAFN